MIKQYVLPVYLLVLCTLSLTCKAQESEEGRKRIEAALPVLDQLFTNYARQNHFPGFVYGLVVDGKLVHTGTFGKSNLSTGTPAGSATAFRIASMTKSFTAMAILKLRDEGKLRLDDPAYLYIPELKGQTFPGSDAAEITVRNLLTHGAGFPEDNPWGDRQLGKTDSSLIALIKKGISFSNPPGMQYEYSNLGFAMLGYIIGKVSGESYEQYISHNILDPLGMKHTYWEFDLVPPRDLAHGYRWLNASWVEQPMLHSGTYGAMGGMITTMEDFIKYVALHLAAWPAREERETGPLKRSSVREMQFPWNFSGFNTQYRYPGGRPCPLVSAYAYGLGWTRDCEGRVYIGHSGGLPGFGSNWRILPDYGIGIISFSNLTYASTSVINMQLLDTLISMARLKPRAAAVSPILQQRKNELMQILPQWKGAEASGIFAENFFLDYFPDSLRKEATELFNRAGRITRVRDMVAENNLRGSFVLEGEHADIVVSFTLTPENPPLIQEYHILLKKKDPL